MHADFAINVDEPREVVEIIDYYFIAKVEEEVDTEYRHSVGLETENGYMNVGEPYTNYKISVMQNIKGDLKTDENIYIYIKRGGNVSG